MKMTTEPRAKSKKYLIYGPPGVGKTTLASQIPGVILIDLEGGSTRIQVRRVESDLWNWTNVLDAVMMCVQTADCSTIVIDTIDRADTLAEQDILRRDGKAKALNQALGGYGAGEQARGGLLREMDQILTRSGKTVVYLAHAGKVSDPAPGGERMVYGPNLSKNWVSYLLQECDEIYFASDKTGPEGAPLKICYTQHSSWCIAKSRSGMPPEIPLMWDAIAGVPTKDMLEEVSKYIATLAPELQDKATAWLRSNPTRYEIQRKFPRVKCS